MKLVIFGSAFNPPTKGHEDAISHLLSDKHNFDRVLLIPSFRHAFNKQMLDYNYRKDLLADFVADIDDPRVDSLPIEDTISKDDHPVFTYDLLHHLSTSVFPEDELFFAIGPDNAKIWHKFYKADEITQRWSLIEVPERKPIRSTLVRRKIRLDEDISALVTPSVAKRIKQYKLYL
ncbi:nicotinate-nicotinamide nucleotide adenylyltransferase [Glaciecola sp. 1036]|uniref:nicotinate-nicotinamide nucleotide adenylyltransferase n=1 Tax=Alteromonadaceae TaxID=72275 RepID=UPI003D0532D4